VWRLDTECRVQLIRREIEYPIELPYGKMASVNSMVAAQHAVKDEPGAFAQALSDGRALD
jgi:hypothetical protein